jgi:hypothetical protein
MINKWLFIALLPGLALVSFDAAAIDTSRPVLCASISVQECEDGGECRSVLAEDVSVPTFFRVDMKNREIKILKTGKGTHIDSSGQLEDQLVLQGVDQGDPESENDGTGWTISINGSTARFVATLTANQAAVVVFGACTEI